MVDHKPTRETLLYQIQAAKRDIAELRQSPYRESMRWAILTTPQLLREKRHA